MMFNENRRWRYYRAVSIVMRDIKTQQIVSRTFGPAPGCGPDDPAIFAFCLMPR